jgi:hypothetical protein
VGGFSAAGALKADQMSRMMFPGSGHCGQRPSSTTTQQSTISDGQQAASPASRDDTFIGLEPNREHTTTAINGHQAA